MGENIEISSFRTLPYSAPSLISLYHGLDPNHSVVLRVLCSTHLYTFLQNRGLFTGLTDCDFNKSVFVSSALLTYQSGKLIT